MAKGKIQTDAKQFILKGDFPQFYDKTEQLKKKIEADWDSDILGLAKALNPTNFTDLSQATGWLNKAYTALKNMKGETQKEKLKQFKDMINSEVSRRIKKSSGGKIDLSSPGFSFSKGAAYKLASRFYDKKAIEGGFRRFIPRFSQKILKEILSNGYFSAGNNIGNKPSKKFNLTKGKEIGLAYPIEYDDNKKPSKWIYIRVRRDTNGNLIFRNFGPKSPKPAANKSNVGKNKKNAINLKKKPKKPKIILTQERVPDVLVNQIKTIDNKTRGWQDARRGNAGGAVNLALLTANNLANEARKQEYLKRVGGKYDPLTHTITRPMTSSEIENVKKQQALQNLAIEIQRAKLQELRSKANKNNATAKATLNRGATRSGSGKSSDIDTLVNLVTYQKQKNKDNKGKEKK